MTTDFQKESLSFAQKCFDDVRAMSKDTTGVSRQGYGPVETKVLEYFKKIGEELKLEISTDKAGNVWMTVPGKNRNLPALVSGSHADSVPQGGNYDGLAGIVAALTVARWMRETGYQPERDYTVLMMRMEESSWFGKCYVGSLGMTGQLTEKDLALKHRSNGKTLAETIKECGFNPDDLTTGKPVVDLSKMAAFIELHIEQGPILDKEQIDIGVVTGVQGISWQEFTLRGVSNHAGTTPMSMRRDAGLAAAKIAVFARELALSLGGNQVATVGHFSVKPNLINVIPNHVVMSVDLRNTDNAILCLAEQQLAEFVAKTSQEEGVEITSRSLVRFNPVIFADEIVNAVEAEAERQALSYRRLPSGAGHDAQFMASVCPAGMIFVPCVDGISHNVKEHSAAKDLIAGANVLLQVVLQRAQRMD